jgi:hypothetical protein
VGHESDNEVNERKYCFSLDGFFSLYVNKKPEFLTKIRRKFPSSAVQKKKHIFEISPYKLKLGVLN